MSSQLGSVVGPEPTSVWFAVGEDGVAVLDLQSMQPISRHPYDTVVTFGGWQDDFMLVVAGPRPAAGPDDDGGRRRPRTAAAAGSRTSTTSSGTTFRKTTTPECTRKLLFQADKHQVRPHFFGQGQPHQGPDFSYLA